MVEQEHESAVATEHPCHLTDGLVDLVDVLEDQAGDGGVERSRCERQRCRRTEQVARAACSVDRRGDLRRERVDADHGAPLAGEHPGDLSFTGADVEHRRCAGELGGDQREDLFGVFGVDAVGELTLPPIGQYGIAPHAGQPRAGPP